MIFNEKKLSRLIRNVCQILMSMFRPIMTETLAIACIRSLHEKFVHGPISVDIDGFTRIIIQIVFVLLLFFNCWLYNTQSFQDKLCDSLSRCKLIQHFSPTCKYKRKKFHAQLSMLQTRAARKKFCLRRTVDY